METIPRSDLYLCKGVELTNDYTNTLDFENKEAQLNYFKSKQLHTFTTNGGYSYVRANRAINLYCSLEDIINCNYMYFKNKDRIYYAFITHKEYISSEVTSIDFEIDVMQTFMFDYTIKESFIEREHQDRWKKESQWYYPIFNREQENIDYGTEYDFICKNINDIANPDWSDNALRFCYVFWNKLPEATDGIKLFKDAGFPTGFYLSFTCENKKDNTSVNVKLGDGTSTRLPTIYELLNSFKINTKPEVTQIVISNVPPAKYTILENTVDFKGYIYCISKNNNVFITSRAGNLMNYEDYPSIQVDESKNVLLGPPGPTIKKDIKYEVKVQSYPYDFQTLKFGNKTLIVKNENKVRNFSYMSYDIKMIQSLSNEATSTFILNDESNKDESSVNIEKAIVQQVPYYVDLVTPKWEQYMLQNKHQRIVGYASSATSALSNVAIGIAGGVNPISMLLAGTNFVQSGLSIASQIAKEADLKNQPPDLTTGTGDLSASFYTNAFDPTVIFYTVKPEIKKRLYDYFYHYGYKCKEFKVPDTKSRYYFNYIKTVSINLASDIDNEYLDIIKENYNKGITIWHYRDSTTFKGINNFEYENAEISLITKEVTNG